MSKNTIMSPTLNRKGTNLETRRFLIVFKFDSLLVQESKLESIDIYIYCL